MSKKEKDATKTPVEVGSHRLEVIETPGEEDETCKTFVFHNEDHTLGNSLRYIIMKNPDVKFCGYSVPHPSELKINFRVQTYGKPAVDILKKGLKDLNGACEHVLRTFENSVSEFKNRNTSSEMDTS
ncbi:DNA-directed RNA polymerases I and III subunit RPAC2-like [Mytilus galloprovincialis]|uniref:DNA-directed RNA polymerases I and III subunit RPAC2-like n=1 Tax=Mytilus edulis TaxID=6550 RepID=UPI0039EEE8E1